MKFYLHILFFISCGVFSQVNEKYSSFVNPFIGTGGHGHTFPGPVSPFGMVQLSPDTRSDGSWDGCGGYHYSDTLIYGFSHTHLSGTGVSDWGDILLTPSNKSFGGDAKKYASAFSHKNEMAMAGTYSVLLNNGIKVQLTTTPRAGIHQYTFVGKQAFLFLDLLHRDKLIKGFVQQMDENTVSGLRISSAWAKEQFCHFTIRFSKPIKKMLFSLNRGLTETLNIRKKEFPEGALFEFDNSDSIPLIVKVSISNVDIEGSTKNLEKEAPHWDFNKYKTEAIDEWDKQLSKIKIAENNKDKKTVFYTALYHCFIHPSLDMDVDKRYRGRDNKIYTADGFTHYNVFSLWDTYRALHPLFTLLETKRTSDFINTFIVQYEQSKRLPVWELSSNETDCMIGYHSVSVITDAYAKGIKSFDARKSLTAMKESAQYNKFGIKKFYNKKFLEVNDESESVSKSLEYAYDNWCIAQMSKMLNNTDQVPELLKSAQAYKNLFDVSTGFMRPRLNGNWYSPFSPYEINNHYTEGNSWHYSFYVPHDIEGLINLHGGDAKFEKKLDELFTTKLKATGRDQADVTGLIGQYAHGNEPSHHSAFLYHYIGKPGKTVQRVEKILSEFYKNTPDGLIGNDDCGQLSAWYVFSAMGMYQVCPGKPEYVLFQPQYREIEITHESGKNIVIQSELNPNKTVSEIEVSGKARKNSFITHDEFINCGKLSYLYKLKTAPDNKYGEAKEDRPVTALKEYPIVPTPIINYTSKTFKTPQMVSIIPVNTKNYTIGYSTNSSYPNRVNNIYQRPFLVSTSTQIRAKVYSLADSSEMVTANLFRINPAFLVKTKSIPNPQYAAGGPQSLVDGVYGDVDWRKGDWQGYQDQDFETLIDIKNPKSVCTVEANFLQDTRSWIIFPTEVSFYYSTDGKKFTLLQTVKNDVSAENYDVKTKMFSVLLETPVKIKQLKVVAKNFGVLPEWHDGKGGKAFIFIDEIEIR